MVHDRLRHNLLGRVAGLMCDHPWAALLAACALAAGALVVTLSSLGFQADRNDLISSELDWNKRYIQYREEFYGYDTIAIIVAVPETDDGPARARQFVDRVHEELAKLNEQRDVFRRVWYGYDPRQMAPILLRLDTMAEFVPHLQQIASAGPMLRSKNFANLIATLPSALQNQSGDETTAEDAVAMIGQFEQLLDGMKTVLDGGTAKQMLEQIDLSGAGEWTYLTSDDGKLLYIDIEGKPHLTEIDQFEPAVKASREALEKVRAEMPDINAGLTGIPVIEADETAMSMRDSTICSIIAVCAIAALLIFAFHGWQLPVLMVVTLLLAITWSFGYLTLAIGHLQVLSVVFTVILLGLGIDFGIHLTSRFELVRPLHPDGLGGFRATIVDTVQATGPGIITGAITTSVAFATTLFTDFKGMAEMGNIAGIGVLLCMIAMLTVLPAMMRLLRPRVHHIKPTALRRIDMHKQAWIQPMVRRPWATCLIAAGLIALGMFGASRVRYDYNLLNLLPDALESVQWQQRVVDHSETAILYGVSIVDSLEDADHMASRFRKLPAVASVGGAGLLFPPDEDEKLAMIEKTRKDLGNLVDPTLPLPEEQPTAGMLRQNLSTLNFVLNIAIKRPDVQSEPPIAAALGRVQKQVTDIIALTKTPEFEAVDAKRLRTLHLAFLDLRSVVRDQIIQSLQTRPLKVSDLPPLLEREVVSVTDPVRYQLKVYPRQNVWNPDDMEPYMDQVLSLDKNFTGSPVQIYESGTLMRQSYLKAGALALIAVLIIAFIDFMSLIDALLCLLPVTIAFVMTFALMWVTGYTINPANIIVLPLMFGIGVASGVHVMHRYRQNPRRRPPGLAAGTGKGIILTSATTIIAFASMLIAEHKGIQSLGFVLAVGIFMTLVACMTIMPAMLEIRNRVHAWRRQRQWRKAGKNN